MDKVDNNVMNKYNKTMDEVIDDRLESMTKFNFKFIIVAVIMLIIMTIVKYGASSKTVLGVGWLIGVCIVLIIMTTILKKPDFKAISILSIGSLAANIYSILIGGSSTGFVVNYGILVVSALYFNKKVTVRSAIPNIVIITVMAFVFPYAIEGPGGQVSGAIAKVIMYIVVMILICLVISTGEKILEKSHNSLIELEEKMEEAEKKSKKLGKTIVQCNRASVGIVTNSNNIDYAAKEISNDCTKIIQGIENVKNSIFDVSEYMIKDVIQELKQQYKEVVMNVDDGLVKVEKTKSNMRIMEDAIDRAASITEILVSNMEDIELILEEIDSIFSQTKMLALNASIEAARAGDSGSGFEVVAEEIRVLSDESTKASNNVKQIMNILNSTIVQVTDKIKEGVRVSEQGYGQMNIITSLLDRINETSGLVEKIINDESNLVNSIKEEFNNVESEMSNLNVLSKDNMNKIIDIQKNINNQNIFIQNLDNKLEHVQQLSNEK